jgi:hypothetical protein
MSKRPDYRVAALNKADDRKATVGVAWKNEDGTIAIVLHAFIVLQGGKDLLLTLFPENEAR